MKEYRLKWIDWVIVVLVMVFYTYGAFGLAREETRELYTSLTPLVLLSSLVILSIYDRSPKQIKALIYMLSEAVVSFCVELIGVATGGIFGEYDYGTS